MEWAQAHTYVLSRRLRGRNSLDLSSESQPSCRDCLPTFERSRSTCRPTEHDHFWSQGARRHCLLHSRPLITPTQQPPPTPPPLFIISLLVTSPGILMATAAACWRLPYCRRWRVLPAVGVIHSQQAQYGGYGKVG